jgi:hypothetical protein
MERRDDAASARVALDAVQLAITCRLNEVKAQLHAQMGRGNM